MFACASLAALAAALSTTFAASPSIRVWPSGVPSDRTDVVNSAQASAAGTDIPLGGQNEVTIVVSPIDPLNLAMSSLHQYRVSTDGGLSWGPAHLSVVPSGYSRSGDPTLAFDSQGRLFYGHLGTRTTGGGVDVFVTELHPATGALIAGPVRVTNSGPTSLNDKPWLAVDTFPDSPFRDRLYVAWTKFDAGQDVLVSFSADHGATWSAPVLVSTPAEGLPWPTHAATAPNGDAYVVYHSQTGFLCNPDGVSGQVVVARSTDGGVSFAQKTLAFGPGEADVTFNVQDCPDGVIPQTDFWMQGSAQAWILPDPVLAGVVSVVANDDPDNMHGSGDDGDVYMARSGDHGLTWGEPSRVDHGAGTSLQVFPTAAIDQSTGCIAVMWYDTRNGAVNPGGNYLLDVFYTISIDGGISFGPDLQLNDVPFDPDKNAPIRDPGPPATRRIGEYIAAAVGAGDFHGGWTGNNISSQQAIVDSVVMACEPPIPPAPAPDPSGTARNRFLSFLVPQAAAASGPSLTALRVRIVDLQNPQPPNAACCPPPDLSMYEADTCSAAGETDGCVRWIGPPVTILESQDSPGLGAFRGARLGCSPYYHAWSAEGLVHVTGAEVVPSSAYEIVNVGGLCMGNEDGCVFVSEPLAIVTARHGDVVAPFNPPDPSTQPDAVDVASLVNKFKNAPGAPSKTSAQLQPNVPNLNADQDALDIAACVDAFKGFAYPFSGPCPCPSQVSCDVTACTVSSQCTGPHGPGARCVRTCTSGPNAGLSCNYNMHCGRCLDAGAYPCDADADCPGSSCSLGACGAGFCRDRCERCAP